MSIYNITVLVFRSFCFVDLEAISTNKIKFVSQKAMLKNSQLRLRCQILNLFPSMFPSMITNFVLLLNFDFSHRNAQGRSQDFLARDALSGTKQHIV